MIAIQTRPTPTVANLSASRNPVVVYLARLAPGSRPTMVDALNKIADLLTGSRLDATRVDWSALTYAEVQALRAKLAGQYAHTTANKILSALRGVVREAWRLRLIDSETYQRIVDVESVKGRSLPPGRALRPGELRTLFDACRLDKFAAAGARDAAILALLYAAGLRRSEVVRLDLGDYDSDTGALKIRSGKGRQSRLGYATNGSKAALDGWIRQRGSKPGPLFVNVTQGGNIVHRRLSDDVVWHVVKKRARQAGVKPFGPHSLRRTFITHLLELGTDVGTVQKLAGHANVQTTLRYDRRGEKAKQKAVELLHVPWGVATG